MAVKLLLEKPQQTSTLMLFYRHECRLSDKEAM